MSLQTRQYIWATLCSILFKLISVIIHWPYRLFDHDIWIISKQVTHRHVPYAFGSIYFVRCKKGENVHRCALTQKEDKNGASDKKLPLHYLPSYPLLPVDSVSTNWMHDLCAQKLWLMCCEIFMKFCLLLEEISVFSEANHLPSAWKSSAYGWCVCFSFFLSFFGSSVNEDLMELSVEWMMQRFQNWSSQTLWLRTNYWYQQEISLKHK